MDTQLTWYGQSAFKIVTPGGKVLLVDPWLSNPVFENAKTEIAALKHVDLILITHGHSDHVGDAVEIGKKTGAKLVATFDLADAMVKHLGYPAEQAQTETIGYFGGELTLLHGEVKWRSFERITGPELQLTSGRRCVMAGRREDL